MFDKGVNPFDNSGYRIVSVRPDAHRVISTSSEQVVAEFKTERLAIEYFLLFVDKTLDRYSKGKLSLKEVDQNRFHNSRCQGCNAMLNGACYSKSKCSERAPTGRKICPECYCMLSLVEKAKLYLSGIQPGSVHIVGSGQTRKP
jgi:hypothetical protein